MLNSSFSNVISGLGTSNDQGANTRFCVRARQPIPVIEGALRVDGVFRNIIEARPEYAIKAWRNWDSEDNDSITQWNDIEDTLGYSDAVDEALFYAEVYGGAVIIPSFDASVVSTEDYTKPFNLSQIPAGGNSLRGWLVYSASELKKHDKKLSLFRPADPRKGFPDVFELVRHGKGYFSAINKTLIHSSWMIPVMGPRSMRHSRPSIGSGYFGESRVDIIYDHLERAVTAQMSSSTAMHKSTIDVFYGSFIEDLDTCGGDPLKIQKVYDDISGRLRQVMSNTSSNHPVALDKDAEKMDRLSSGNISSMDQLMNTFAKLMCAAAKVPLTIALGDTPSGLTSNDDSGIKNWAETVEAYAKKRLPPVFRFMDEIAGHDMNVEPIRWKLGELITVGPKERAEIELNNARRDEIYSENIGLPRSLSHIMKNLASGGVYAFSQEEIKEAKEFLDEIDGSDEL